MVASSPIVPVTDVCVVYIGSVVAVGAISANEAANVERTTMVTVGMKFVELVPRSLCFNGIRYFQLLL